MANSQKRLERGVLIGLIAILSLAGGLVYVTSGGGSATAQAQPVDDIVQVTSEEGGYSAPALLEINVAGTPRLLLAYGSVNDEDSGLFVKTSEDGGTTWSQPALVANGDNAAVPSLAQEADGTVWLVYARPQWRSYYRTSEDGGTTWSEES